ncbi:uncharacterized protein LOC141846465 [Curcuma longa]|uniref:uncharacterized protein LOC141846465 n=1 Tax=Curcuma longa TaxID=136217 RepID=UPI003D9EB5D8
MAVKKLFDDFTILLFHYDGRASDWEQFEWSKRAIHVSIKKQTKWWYAKRFLHPDVVAAYDYIFVWDDNIGVEHFNADKYLHLVKKYGLEISQPGMDPNEGLTWEMTKRRIHSDVHKETMEKPGSCTDPHLPPCAAFVEIVAPVFSRNAWRCVWHMIQNDLVHGWGLDFAFARCVEPAHEKIGVVDAQWICYQSSFIRDQHRHRSTGREMPPEASLGRGDASGSVAWLRQHLWRNCPGPATPLEATPKPGDATGGAYNKIREFERKQKHLRVLFRLKTGMVKPPVNERSDGYRFLTELEGQGDEDLKRT